MAPLISIIFWIVVVVACFALAGYGVIVAFDALLAMVGSMIEAIGGALATSVPYVIGFIAVVVAVIVWGQVPDAGYRRLCREKSLVGQPRVLLPHWEYEAGPTWPINAQRMILAAFGIERTEEALLARQRAYSKSNARVGASSVYAVLKGYGLKLSSQEVEPDDFGLALYRALNANRLIILSVNLHILNHPDEQYSRVRPKATHIIVVTALSSSGEGPESLTAHYTDPASPDGSVRAIPLKSLLSASAGIITLLPALESPLDASLDENEKKPVACPFCKAHYRIPADKVIEVKCPGCGGVARASYGVFHRRLAEQ